jgi:hypothetical protein
MYNFKETNRLLKEINGILTGEKSQTSEEIAIIRAYNREAKLQMEEKKQEKQNYIISVQSFTLFLQYNKKQENGLFWEEIELEGIENGINILETYRKIGHNLNLNYISLNCKDENETSVKRINFKY